jgi:hypothetical protein
MDPHETDTPARTKPAYHRSMPWQIAVALVFTGLDGLALAFNAVTLGAIAASAPQQFRWMPLLLTVLVALAAVVYLVLGVCVAARLKTARKLAVIVNFILLLFALMALAVSGAVGGFNVLALVSGGFSLFMIALLNSEQAQAYAYRGGDDSWPED